MAGLSVAALAGLACGCLVAGIGITAVGPGGVLVTIALSSLSSLVPARIAGTAIVTYVATGLLGSAVFTLSGELREPWTRRTAATLCGMALVGTPVGVALNSALSRSTFGVLLGVLVAVFGVLVLVRARRGSRSAAATEADRPAASAGAPRPALVGAIGFGVAALSGLFGLGGPLLSVPLLVGAGMAPLSALAAAQAQSVVIAAVGAIGYASRGAIVWSLVPFVAVPELAGVVLGWRIARRIPARVLTAVLAAVLLAIAPYLILR